MAGAMVMPEPAPRRIVEPDGSVHVGWFDAPIVEPNLSAAPARHALSGLRGTPLALVERGYRRLRLKEWLYVSVVSPRALFACAVVNAGYVGSAFAYAVDRASGKMHEWSTMAPLGRGVTIAPSSIEGETSIERAGFGRITIDSFAGGRRVRASLKGLEADYVFHEDLAPVVVVEESAPGRWLYTHKCYGFRAEGSMSGVLTDRTSDGLAGVDYNRGYRPRETWWHWAAAAGRAQGGAVVGFNLTAHRPWDAPRGGPADALDCALWLDGERVKIQRVEFDDEPWRIVDDAGLVDLRFFPDGERRENIHLGVVVSRFAQPYGRFEGVLRSPGGRRFELADVFGVTERHYARW